MWGDLQMKRSPLFDCETTKYAQYLVLIVAV